MKKFKNVLLVVIFGVMIVLLVACQNDGGKTKIGILQYATHDALDDAREGFIKALSDAGFVDGENITIQVLNPQGDATIMQTQAAKLVRESDLILAIATLAAQAIKTQIVEQGKSTPVLFTAVTDPVDAGLINTMAKPGGNITGTSDMNPIKEQIDLLMELKPSVKKLGILYTANESNSEIQANIAKDAALLLEIETVIQTVITMADISGVLTNLITQSQVDAIYIPTDNLLSSAIGQVEEIVKQYPQLQIPIVPGEAAMVHNGGSLTYGLSYFNLGVDTGNMAVLILNGANPRDIPSTTVQTFDLVINKKQLTETFNMEIPESILDRADVIIE